MKKKALFIFVLVICISFGSCSTKNAFSCEDILGEMLKVSGENVEGNGIIYFANADESTFGYLSQEDKELIYGKNRVEQLFDCKKIEDYAMFFSTRGVGEIAIFKCYSRAYTKETARMCMERADEIKVLLRNSEWREKSEGIKVVIYKEYVLMIFAEQPHKVENRFKNLI